MDERPSNPPRVVLRYEVTWPGLLSRLERDRAAAAAASHVPEALVALYDEGSFVQVGSLARREAQSYDPEEAATNPDDEGGDPLGTPDGTVAGWGTRNGRLVFLTADGPSAETVRSQAGAAKASRLRGHALAQAGPIIQLLCSRRLEPDSFVGAQYAAAGFGLDLEWERASSTVIPKVAIVTGPLVDQAAYEATCSHLVIFAGTQASLRLRAGQALAGDDALRAGVADAVSASVADAVELTCRFLDLMPDNPWSAPPVVRPGPPTAIPHRDQGPAEVVGAIVDEGELVSLRAHYCPEVLTAIGRLDGRPVGLAALPEQVPLRSPALVKVDRLVGLCEAFQLPLVVVHGQVQLDESDVDALDHAATVWTSWLAATVPTVTLAVRAAPPPAFLAKRPSYSGAWEADRGGARQPDETFDPPATRARLVRALRALPVNRLERWEDRQQVDDQPADENLFSRPFGLG